MTETKKCTKCGEEKSSTEFYWDSQRNHLRSLCKSCFRKSTMPSQIRYRNSQKEIECRKRYNRSEKNIQKRKESTKKARACAKVFCHKLEPSRIVECICKNCGKKYGLPKHIFDSRMRGNPRYYPKYCSRLCQRIAVLNQNREKTAYAKKIKELQKVYK